MLDDMVKAADAGIILANRVCADQARPLTRLKLVVRFPKPVVAVVGPSVDIRKSPSNSVEIGASEFLLGLVLALVRRIADDRIDLGPF